MRDVLRQLFGCQSFFGQVCARPRSRQC
jgi:hypothetical protein